MSQNIMEIIKLRTTPDKLYFELLTMVQCRHVHVNNIIW